MDPDKAFRDFQNAVTDRHYVKAAQIALDLLEWIERGGFRPKGFTKQAEAWVRAYDHRETSP